mmetsp:Transcript_11087/g.12195  ORF Transcript_11087/g.12195 Transcript_11087/m.12195 type:complete len:322 (-) Transcript_11087:295-1260(-)
MEAPIQELPPEVLYHILLDVPKRAIQRCLLVSKFMHYFIATTPEWRFPARIHAVPPGFHVRDIAITSRKEILVLFYETQHVHFYSVRFQRLTKIKLDSRYNTFVRPSAIAVDHNDDIWLIDDTGFWKLSKPKSATLSHPHTKQRVLIGEGGQWSDSAQMTNDDEGNIYYTKLNRLKCIKRGTGHPEFIHSLHREQVVPFTIDSESRVFLLNARRQVVELLTPKGPVDHTKLVGTVTNSIAVDGDGYFYTCELFKGIRKVKDNWNAIIPQTPRSVIKVVYHRGMLYIVDSTWERNNRHQGTKGDGLYVLRLNDTGYFESVVT